MNNKTRISRLERLLLELVRIQLGHTGDTQNTALTKIEDELKQIVGEDG